MENLATPMSPFTGSQMKRLLSKRSKRKSWFFPFAIEDVKRKVHILCALTGHENVVHFHNAFEDNDYVYIIMELCEGGELLDRILAEKDSNCYEIDAAKNCTRNAESCRRVSFTWHCTLRYETRELSFQIS